MTVTSVIPLCLIICFSVFSVCNCANISQWEEGPCSRMPLTIIENEDSSESKEIYQVDDDITWYTPLWSKYELYKSASLVSGIPVKDLTDDDIKKSCLVTKAEKIDIFVTEGFGGKKIEVVTVPGKFGGYLWKLKGEKKYRGEFWITLVGKDFAVSVTCWANGHHSYSASSKSKTFDAGTKQKIVKHVTSLGFDPKYIYDYSYDGCTDI